MAVETLTAAAMPAVPLTLEGASMLHQFKRVRWPAWRAVPEPERQQIVSEAAEFLTEAEQRAGGQSALYGVLGHKGDIALVHFRQSFAELQEVQQQVTRLRLNDYLEDTTSYLSVVELGLYESTAKTYQGLIERGVEPHSPEWEQGVGEVLARQRTAMASRLFPDIPEARYLCFYPMDRRRGEDKNWYTVPLADRQRMMHEHGLVGRRYAGTVRQIISASIGFDDWEWGVDLFADDPLVFKKLIYEMRFDEVSAVYALFGSFYVGLRQRPQELPALFSTEPGASA